MGNLVFAAPLLLAALAALPLLYLLIRQTPPKPQSVALPTLKLLAVEDIPPPQSARPPLWLLLFRLAALALLILGLSGPRLIHERSSPAPDRLVIIIDNGMFSAARWPEMTTAATERIDALEGAETRFAIVPTAAETDPAGPARFVDADTARAQLSAIPLRPWPLDREAAARRLPGDAPALWLADGVESGGAAPLRSAISGGEVRAFPADEPAIIASGPTSSGVAVRLSQAVQPAGSAPVFLLTASGRKVSEGTADFENGVASLRLNVPTGDAGEIERISAGSGPAANVLVSGGLSRPRVAIFDNGADVPPLQRGSFYIRRAVEPSAEIVQASLGDGASSGANLFYFDDVAMSEANAEPYLARVEQGAVAVSFAGPRTAENGTALSPVPLRTGARAFGGTISWEEPQRIAGFSDDGPLAGLVSAEDDHQLRRQLLARDIPEDALVWATLEDGTPMVTARRLGRGLLVMVHGSAAPDWSDLPLSGLFADMLGRFLTLARDPQAMDISEDGDWRLDRQMTGTARLSAPEVGVTIPASEWRRAIPGPERPPGIYRNGDVSRALNLTSWFQRNPGIRPLDTSGLRPAEVLEAPRELGPFLLAAAALVIAVDLFVALYLRGAFRRRIAGFAAPAAAAVLALVATPTDAQEVPVDNFALAYVGGTAADPEIERGLENLIEVLRRRTAVHPGPPVGISPSDAEIGRYPLIYWPAYARGAMTPRETANIRAYLARGGLILFDFGRPFDGTTDARTLLAPLGLPTLDEVRPDHVLMKSYYLIGTPGGGALWAEADTKGESGRVSSVLIGGGDWARIWSGSRAVPPSVRENALRFGVNTVLYALTGTYKADQVHTQTLLDRIGRDRAD